MAIKYGDSCRLPNSRVFLWAPSINGRPNLAPAIKFAVFLRQKRQISESGRRDDRAVEKRVFDDVTACTPLHTTTTLKIRL